MTLIKRAPGMSLYANPQAAGPDVAYDTRELQPLNGVGFAAAFEQIRRWPGYEPTPLVGLPGLARELGLAQLHYKDENWRFALKSFKALGGAYAVFRLIQEAVAQHSGLQAPDASVWLAGRYRALASQMTVTCATDGNHGRSVAWGAQTFGCQCVIYVHSQVSQARADAIAAFGARVERVAGNYDDSVRHAAEQAQNNGWHVVSDTTYEGYRDIPIDVMHGYGVMAHEVVQTMAPEAPTHVIVQAGVGAFAASVCAAFWLAWKAQRPRFVVVEPTTADCLFQSALAKQPVAVGGDLDTVMAGLACGEVSPVAWEILCDGVNDFASIADHYALEGMKRLANPTAADPAVVSGETGAAGLGLLLAVQQHPHLKQALGLGPHSRVLLLGSEGDTDPAIYREVVGKTSEEVLAA
jgi:diaminopropionate ammonia-lyase